MCSDVISEMACIWRCMIALWAFVCEWACAVLGFQQGQMNLHIVHICVISVQCGWSNDLVLPQYSCFTKWLLYFTVDEQMPFKISSLTKLPIALDTGDILFSDMGCQPARWLFKIPAWSNDSSPSEQKCIFSPLFESKCLVISLWFLVGVGRSSTMAFFQPIVGRSVKFSVEKHSINSWKEIAKKQ